MFRFHHTETACHHVPDTLFPVFSLEVGLGSAGEWKYNAILQAAIESYEDALELPNRVACYIPAAFS